MSDAPPSWYVDPTNRHELRFWDGSRWTEHVSSGGVGGIDPVGELDIASDGTHARSGMTRLAARSLGLVGLLLCVLAVVAVSVPGVGLARATSEHGVRLDGSDQHIRLPPHQKYGIYVDDANNSGYSEECSAVDVGGRPVRMADPSWSFSSSDTETLDFVFNTGSGALTINCSVPGERATTRPVANLRPLLLGLGLAAILGCSGVAMIVAWLVSSSRRKRQPIVWAGA